MPLYEVYMQELYGSWSLRFVALAFDITYKNNKWMSN